jgi:hypothetical protein
MPLPTPPTVSLETYVYALGIGSALIAFWFVARFPKRSPAGYTPALLHVIVALLLGPVASYISPIVWNRGYPLIAIFAVLLPVLVYTFLSAAWFFRLATQTLHRYRN